VRSAAEIARPEAAHASSAATDAVAFRSYRGRPSDSKTMALLDSLIVQLDAIAVCEIGQGCGLSVEPVGQLMVHFVLSGEGTISTSAGEFAVERGMIAVIPAGTPKLINGVGPVERVFEAESSCPLQFGFLRYRAVACGEAAGLVLACALVSATVGDGLGVFDHLQQPLTAGPGHADSFHAMARELSGPGAGTKPMVQAQMTQILLHAIREHLVSGEIDRSALAPLTHPRLRPAVLAMTSRPEARHSLKSLSQIAGMSRTVFAHCFAEAYGVGPINYLLTVRLRAAARLLQGSDAGLKVIAAAVGFESRSYFSRAFSAKFGMAPAQFRVSTRPAAQPDHEVLFSDHISASSESTQLRAM